MKYFVSRILNRIQNQTKSKLFSFFRFQIPDTRDQVKASRAFTLVELMVTVFLVGIIGVAVNQFQSTSSINARAAQTKLLAADQARLTLRRFLEEIRTTSQSSTGAYAIGLTQGNALTFYSDIYGDGLKERVKYYLDSKGALKKGITRPTGSPLTYNDSLETTSTLTGPLSNPSSIVFFYYDTNDVILPAPTPASIRSVKMVLVMAIDPKAPSTTVSFETRATFRNLKDNY